ncbi:MAG: pilus assembly protein [Chloroflexi bacterium]|nr:pilus assembly protein [Chloroflexota bacterium]
MAGQRRSQALRSRGQALAEFAIIAPIFFFTLFAIIEFGRAVYTIQMLNNAAREGARYAIVHGAASTSPSGPFPATYPAPNSHDPTGLNVVNRVKQFAIAIIDSGPSDFAVSVKWCANDGDIAACPGTYGDGDNGRNQNVLVTVNYKFKPLLGMVPLPTFDLSGGSTLVINH